MPSMLKDEKTYVTGVSIGVDSATFARSTSWTRMICEAINP